MAAEIRGCGNVAEIDESGVEINESNGPVTSRTGLSVVFCLVLGRSDDERDAGGALPTGPLSPVLFFTKVPTVIGPENDDGVVFVGRAIELVEDAGGSSPWRGREVCCSFL